MEYMVRFVYGNTRWIGFHSIPRDRAGRLSQPLSALGTPTSSGCIRQRLSNAAQLYRFAPVGTRVVVVP
jgi:lipoprotein-anchoring transpeptidase ErfK/SrfK